MPAFGTAILPTFVANTVAWRLDCVVDLVLEVVHLQVVLVHRALGECAGLSLLRP